MKNKKRKRRKARNFLAISAWFRTSAGPMKSKKQKKRYRRNKDWKKEHEVG